MNAFQTCLGEFDLGEFLGFGLNTNQIAHLAGSLILSLFGLSALRRAKHAAGPLPAVWIAVAIGLIAGGLLVAARGFPDQVPDELKPWADPDRLLRVAAVVGLLACSIILLSAHWVQRPLWRFGYRLLGLALAGTAVWLAAGWFGDQLPDEARSWAARPVVSRALALAALVFLALTFWFRPEDEAPHRRWMARTLTAPAIALAIVFGLRWFGANLDPDVPVPDIIRITVVLAAIATGTCAIIAAGAYGLRERRIRRPAGRRSPAVNSEPQPPLTGRPLPVAVLLDDHGRPVLPAQPHQGGE